MLNSFSRSSASLDASVSISNVGNTINFSPITRTNAEAKFKKVKINSLEFDLMTSEIPSIINGEITKLEYCDYNWTDLYEYSIQAIQILSFNQIQMDTMLIEYLLIGEPKKQKIGIWNPRGEKIFSKNEVFINILKKLLTDNF